MTLKKCEALLSCSLFITQQCNRHIFLSLYFSTLILHFLGTLCYFAIDCHFLVCWMHHNLSCLKICTLSRLTFSQDKKLSALSKVAELESEILEYKSQLLHQQTALSESGVKNEELKATLSGHLEEQSAFVNHREQEIAKNNEKIADLQRDLEERRKERKDLEIELKTTVSLWFC